ncbi:MAG: transglycosylase SLT domain-containing protein [Acetobacteraceae bacterium]
MRRLFPLLLSLLPTSLLPLAAQARPEAPTPASFCEAAIATAEVSARLPPRLMTAISITESGRIDPVSHRTRAWPWTINAEGTGQFFATKADAIAAVKALQARGVRSIDVGCMQVNLMFHPNAFANLEEAFDPTMNARYAARFLSSLYGAKGNWPQAIAAYHSETPALGAAYGAIVMARWEGPNLSYQPQERSPYQAFGQSDRSYQAFATNGRVYGAFTMGPGTMGGSGR